MNPDVQAGTIPYHLLDFEAELTMEQIQEREAADDYGGHRRVMLYTFTRSGRQLLEGCREDGTGEGLVAALDVLKEFKQHLAVLQGMTEAAERLAISTLSKLLAAGDDPGDVIDQSIEFGYRGLFPLKRDGPAAKRGHHPRRDQQPQSRTMQAIHTLEMAITDEPHENTYRLDQDGFGPRAATVALPEP